MALKDWEKEKEYTFSKWGFERYGGGKRFEIMQIGRYRDADWFDEALKNKEKWHGKWYVDVFDKKVKLFKTKKDAMAYAKKYMREH